jgi:hypothetical protein
LEQAGMKYFKKWWNERYDIVDVAFGVSFSEIHLRLIVFDYGVSIKFEFPFILEKLNLLHWATYKLFHFALNLAGMSDDISFSRLWVVPQDKWLELEIAPVRDIVAVEYRWKVHTDHWGHWALLAVAGLELSAKYIDSRHWDNITNEISSEG